MVLPLLERNCVRVDRDSTRISARVRTSMNPRYPVIIFVAIGCKVLESGNKLYFSERKLNSASFDMQFEADF